MNENKIGEQFHYFNKNELSTKSRVTGDCQARFREKGGRKSLSLLDCPIADDDIGFQMRRIDANLIDWEQFVKELEHKGGETYQYFFGTERSLKYLRKL